MSVTVTVLPSVGAAPMLLMVIVYVSALSPGRKGPGWLLLVVRLATWVMVWGLWPGLRLPVWLLLMVKSATWVIVVGSLALARLTAPPPVTVAVLVTLAGALLSTRTVSVRAG